MNISALNVAAEGGVFPRISTLRVDLTHARIDRAMRPLLAKSSSTVGLQVEALEVTASPLHLEHLPAQLALRAHEVELDLSRDDAGRPLLALTRAANGSVKIEITREELEAAALQFAKEEAAPHGIEVKALRLTLTQTGPRSLQFQAEVTARAFIMKAKVTVTGEIEVDDQLQLRFSKLTGQGDGMIGTLANKFLRPRFDELERRPIALLSFAPAGLRVRDLRLEAGDKLRIEADFSA